RDLHRRAFDDRHRDIDGILLVIQLDVETSDARVWKSAVAVEGLDSFQVRVEARAIEVPLPAPWQLRALARGERVLQARFIDRFDALERELVNLDGAFFFT